MAPTPRAMRRILKIWDKYADQFNIVFNAKMSKYFACRKEHVYDSRQSVFDIGGNVLKNIDDLATSWAHHRF